MIWAGLIICCGIAALLAGMESALLAVSRVRVRHAADEGDKRAEKLAIFLERRNELLQTAIIANHAFSLAAFALLAVVLRPWAGNWSVAVAAPITLPLFLLLLEMLPKSFSRRYPFRFLKRLNLVLHVLQFIALPWYLLVRLARPAAESNMETNAAANGLEPVIDDITSLKLLPETATDLLRSFSSFNQLTARDVMKSLADITALPADLPLPTAMAMAQQGRRRHHAVLSDKGTFIGRFDAASVPPGAGAGKVVGQFAHPLVRVKTSDGALLCLQTLRKAGMPLALVMEVDEKAAGLLDTSELIDALLDLQTRPDTAAL